MRSFATSGLLAALLLPSAIRAQVPQRDTLIVRGKQQHADTLVAKAIRAERAPAIDGRDDDPVWSTAPAFSEFQEFSPTEGKDPRFKTEFKVAYDDRHIYVFIRA